MGNPIARGIEIGGDFLGENVRVGKIVGVFEPFVPEPKDVALRKVAGPLYRSFIVCTFWRFPAFVTTTMQPVCEPAQLQSEQRQVIPMDSFLRFPPRRFTITIFWESHSGQILIRAGGNSILIANCFCLSVMSHINQ
jgi:hypothetical protein